jgi:hypothetical protein
MCLISSLNQVLIFNTNQGLINIFLLMFIVNFLILSNKIKKDSVQNLYNQLPSIVILTKFMANFIFVIYLLTLLLNHATNHTSIVS